MATTITTVEPIIGYIKPQLVHTWPITDDNIEAVAQAANATVVDDNGTLVLVTADGEVAKNGMTLVRMPGGRMTAMVDTVYSVMIGEDFDTSQDGQVRAPQGDWWTLTSGA